MPAAVSGKRVRVSLRVGKREIRSHIAYGERSGPLGTDPWQIFCAGGSGMPGACGSQDRPDEGDGPTQYPP